jgi:hypothetical protein
MTESTPMNPRPIRFRRALLPRYMGRPTPMPTPQPTPKPVKTWRTFTLKGFSIRNEGGGSLRSRGLAIDVRWRTAAGTEHGRGGAAAAGSGLAAHGPKTSIVAWALSW